MVIKRFLFLLLMFAVCISFTIAQEEDDSVQETDQVNYFIDRTADGVRFIQRLMCEAGDYVLRYVVIVERQSQNRYTEVGRFESKENFADVSLTVGEYRFSVEVYDLFDELSFVTRWREFEVFLAVQPVLSGFTPNNFYLDEETEWVINLRGQNLLSSSEYYLVQNNRRIHPLSHVSEGSSARLVFSAMSLVPGQYDIYVRNPGGLDARLGTFNIALKKPFDLYLSAGFAPIIPLYGYLFKDTELEAPFSRSFFPLGAAAKIGFVPMKRVWGSLGVEASGSYTMLEMEKEYYTAKASFLNVHLSLLYQVFFLNKKFSFNAILGGGSSSLFDFHYVYQIGSPTEKIDRHYPSAITGLSFMAFLSGPLLINAGADYIHMFTSSDDSPMPGFLRPFLLVGVRF